MSKQIVKHSVKLKDDTKLSKVQKKQVKELLKSEQQLKWFGVNASNQVIDWAGAVISLSSTIQGAGDTNRNGDTLKVTSLSLSYTATNPAVATVGLYEQILRFIVIRWLPIDTTPPVLGDILNTTATKASIFSQYNDDRRDQFNVLYDKSHICAAKQVASTYVPMVAQKFIKAKQRIEYNAGTSNGTGKLYLIVVSNVDTAAAAGEKCLFDYFSVMRFTNS